MPHKKGHLQQAMDSIPAKNSIIKKLDSIYGVNAEGFPYRKDTKTMADSIVVKPKMKKRGV